MTASEKSAPNWAGETIRHASAHRTPATAAQKPETARMANFTVAGLTPNAADARSLSRTATTSRPGVDRRRAAPVSSAITSTTSATK